MLKKASLLAILVVIFSSIIYQNTSLRNSTPQPNITKILSPEGKDFSGKAEIISLRLASVESWGAELEATFNSPGIGDSIIAVESFNQDPDPGSFDCIITGINLPETGKSHPNKIKFWVLRPPQYTGAFSTGKVKIAISQYCHHRNGNSVKTFNLAINWPDITSLTNNKNIVTTAKHPRIAIRIESKESVNLINHVLNSGHPLDKLTLYSAGTTIHTNKKTTSVALYNQTSPSYLNTIFESLNRSDKKILVANKYHTRHIENADVEITFGGMEGTPVTASALQTLLKENISDFEFYKLIGLNWTTPEQKARELSDKARAIMNVIHTYRGDFKEQKLVEIKKFLDEAIILSSDIPEIYIEIARYRMKVASDFSAYVPSPTGKHVLGILSDANKQFPNHANTLILLGYVQITQNRLKEGEASLLKAKEIGSQNLWLWNNLALLYKKQDRPEKALEMFKKTANTLNVGNINNSAMDYAVGKLVNHYIKNGDYDSADHYYDRHHAEITGNFSYAFWYHSDFLSIYTDKIDKAIKLFEIAKSKGCECKESLSMVFYRKWTETGNKKFLLRAKSSSGDQAKIIYNFSKSEYGLSTIQHMINIGIDINVESGDQTALTYAIKKSNLSSVKALLKAGANAGLKPSNGYFNPLELAVSHRNIDIIKTLMKYGADPTQINQHGFSALQMGQHSGDTDLMSALDLSKVKL